MGAISVDSQGHAGQQRSFSPKTVGRAAIVAGALAVAGLGAYWLATAPPAVRSDAAGTAAATARPAEPGRAAEPPLLNAPAATCVDGRPASEEVPADACR